jgi:hypothetical protein
MHNRCIAANPKLYGNPHAHIQRPTISWGDNGYELVCIEIDMRKYRSGISDLLFENPDEPDFSEFDEIYRDSK